MVTRKAFAKALRETRKARGLTQEDFSTVSSRTYLSALERELKNPTLDKIDELASILKIHPLTLLTMTYAYANRSETDKSLMVKINREIRELRALNKKR